MGCRQRGRQGGREREYLIGDRTQRKVREDGAVGNQGSRPLLEHRFRMGRDGGRKHGQAVPKGEKPLPQEVTHHTCVSDGSLPPSLETGFGGEGVSASFTK